MTKVSSNTAIGNAYFVVSAIVNGVEGQNSASAFGTFGSDICPRPTP